MMKNILIAVLAFLIGFMVANNYVASQEENEDKILKKLEEVLENQETMVSYLKFIKNRA